MTRPTEHHAVRTVRKNGTAVIDCASCGFWHVDPIPSPEALRRHYETAYFETLGDNRSMTDKRSDPDGFYTLSYEDKLRRLQRLLPGSLPRTVLDIGAGYGDFLRFMAAQGWTGRGIEPSRQAVELCRAEGLAVTHGAVDDLASADLAPAAVVTLNSVLEHLADPWTVIEVVRDRLLLPGGVLNIHVPNDFSPLQQVLAATVLRETPKRARYWIAVPDHVNYWTHRSLAAFVERLGFRVRHLTSTFPLEVFPLMGEDYITEPALGRGIHLKRVRFEQRLREAGAADLKDALYAQLAAVGIGREIEAFATVER